MLQGGAFNCWTKIVEVDLVVADILEVGLTVGQIKWRFV